MWLSQLLEFLKSSRSAAPGLTSSRRAGRPRPLVVEPLEDRLTLTGKVALDVPPGTGTRPKPPVIMTFVLEVAVNWLDANLGGRVTTPVKPPDTNGDMNRDSNLNPQGDLSSFGIALSPMTAPALGNGIVEPPGLAAAPATAAGIDTYFQHSTAVGSF